MERALKVLRVEAEAISQMAERLDRNFDRAVELISGCTGRVVVTGMGKSGIIGKKISATLASTGTPAFFLHPAEGSHGDLGMVAAGDVAIALSNSGETEELVRLLPVFKRMDIKVISIVGNMESTLARRSDVALDASVSREACPLGLAPTASTTAALAMGDALAMEILDAKGFKEEDFALFHPGGALGKRLILTVGELMHRGSEIPKVDSGAQLQDVLLEISSKRLGLTTVVDRDGDLIGVVTDGDLRRGFEKWGPEMLSVTASEMMSAGPKTISPEALAAEALAIMQKHEITAIVSVDVSGIQGVIHMHDLLKAGIV